MSRADEIKPYLVIVTGEPGSGKSTLGKALADALRVPYLSRDDVRWGLRATSGLWNNQLTDPSDRSVAVEAFLQLVEHTARLGVSAVLEFMVFADRPETLDRLRRVASCLVVVAACDNARDRAISRDREHPLLNRPEVIAALGHESLEAYLSAGADEAAAVRSKMLVDLGLPTLAVRTDDGCDPALTSIVDWVIAQTRR